MNAKNAVAFSNLLCYNKNNKISYVCKRRRIVKTITSVELAKLAGVSQSTVSRCLNDSPLVSEETKARVKKIAAEYSFQFNTNARGLKTNRTGVVGYIFSEDFTGFANHYIQSDLYYRIRMQLLRENLDVVPVFDDRTQEDQSAVEKSISNRRFDALIFNRPQVNDRVRNLLQETRIPYIFIYDTNEVSEEPFMIAPHHTEIGRLAGDAFCRAGYERFVELTGPSQRIDVVHKHTGFTEALRRHGFGLPPSHILCADYHLEQATEQTLAHIELFQSGTACFAQNDLMALGVIEALRQKQLRVPEDVAIIGADNIAMGTWFHPQLTTVAVDYDRIIELTVDWVLAMTEGRSLATYRYLLDSELVIRDTFVPPSQSGSIK